MEEIQVPHGSPVPNPDISLGHLCGLNRRPILNAATVLNLGENDQRPIIGVDPGKLNLDILFSSLIFYFSTLISIGLY